MLPQFIERSGVKTSQRLASITHKFKGRKTPSIVSMHFCLAPIQNPQFGPPEKSLCALLPGKERTKVTHTTFSEGLWGQKGGPKRAMLGHKNLCFLLLAHRNRSDFCDLRLRCPSRTPEIARFPRQDKAMLHCDLSVRWKVASDLRFRAAISEPKTPSFCGISGDLGQSTRKSLAIAIVRFWCAKFLLLALKLHVRPAILDHHLCKVSSLVKKQQRSSLVLDLLARAHAKKKLEPLLLWSLLLVNTLREDA